MDWGQVSALVGVASVPIAALMLWLQYKSTRLPAPSIAVRCSPTERRCWYELEIEIHSRELSGLDLVEIRVGRPSAMRLLSWEAAHAVSDKPYKERKLKDPLPLTIAKKTLYLNHHINAPKETNKTSGSLHMLIYGHAPPSRRPMALRLIFRRRDHRARHFAVTAKMLWS